MASLVGAMRATRADYAGYLSLSIFVIIKLHQITLHSQGERTLFVCIRQERKVQDMTNPTMDEAGQAGTHIWLRYATQFTVGERSCTVEMGIPVPVGASAEERAALLREAEAGMSQLSQSVENRVAHMLQQSAHATKATSHSSPSISSVSAQPTRPTNRPASVPAPQTAPLATSSVNTPVNTPIPQAQPAQTTVGRAPAADAKEVKVPPTRATVGASMPRTPGNNGGDMAVPDFIAAIRENLGLNPKEAMTLLKVKSLSGLNLRDAFEQLQTMTPQKTLEANATNTASSSNPTQERNTSAMPKLAPTSPTQSLRSTESSTSTSQLQPAREGNSYERVAEPISMVRERGAASGFDEEIGPDDEEEDELDDLDNLNELAEEFHELTPAERTRARTLLNEMREMRGATVANANRLQVLRNLADQQVSDADLQSLIKGVWGVTSLKKLKVDQVERLISWAKEDDFIEEVGMVLQLLEEG